ncbi:MAG: hypothetical protein JNK46_03145, partial [Methylobacteriaceae bacterium]|nr:hypothetical protein [Methylobacteriaceae bacterium]
MRTPEVPGGVIVYDKPVMRNGRLVTWSGAWRQRKGGGAETGRRSAYAETPRRE